MSVTARKKKAFAQLEESEKAVESKRKALQQAQEALEEALQKHAAAQEACGSVEQEIEEEEDEDDECMQDAEGILSKNGATHLLIFSESAEIQEVRTAVSQISATLALLVKALPRNQVLNSVEEAANTLQHFRSASERHKPYKRESMLCS